MEETKIKRHAYRLWEDAGRPEGRDQEFWEKAKELAAIEENQGLAMKPRNAGDGPWGEPVESAIAIDGQADVPGRTDQGEDDVRPPRFGNDRS